MNNYKYYVYIQPGHIEYFNDYNEAVSFTEHYGLDEDAVVEIEHGGYDLN